MTFRLSTIATLISILLFASCAKDHTTPDAGTMPLTPLFLLDRIEYKSISATATYTYNTDSTVKQIFQSATGAGAAINYTYQNRQLTRTAVPGSLYITDYTYANGYLTTVTNSQLGQGVIGYKLVYSYAANGLLNEMRHFKIDEAGDHLQYLHLYQYNIEGLLAKITSISTNVSFTTTINSYSEACDFEPSSFVNSSGLDQLYALYNYPVLSRLAKLPKRITVVRTEGQQAPVTERVYDAEFTITNKKIEKIKPTVSYPSYPQYNVSDEWLFYYK